MVKNTKKFINFLPGRFLIDRGYAISADNDTLMAVPTSVTRILIP